MRGRRCSARVGRRSRRAHRDRGGSASSPVPARPEPDDPLLDEAQKAAHMVNADERAWIHKACLGSECPHHA